MLQDKDRIKAFVASPVDRETHLRKMAHSFNCVVMSTLLPMPEKGKWTKFTPALDWCLNMSAHNNMLEKVGQPLRVYSRGWLKYG